MNITAVIPALNEAEQIAETITSIQKQTVPIDEIILVDSGSTDGTQEIARMMGCTVMDGIKNIGYNRDIGTRAARNDLILSVDADTWLPEDWVEHALRHFESYNVVAVVGKVEPKDPTPLNRFWSDLRNSVANLHTMQRSACVLFFRPQKDEIWCLQDICVSYGEFSHLKENLDDGFMVYDQSLVSWTDIPADQPVMAVGLVSAAVALPLTLCAFYLYRKKVKA